MRFYGIQPSELWALDPVDRYAIERNMNSIRMRERLELQNDFAMAFSDGDDTKKSLMDMGMVAFEDDERTLGIFMDAISRKRR